MIRLAVFLGNHGREYARTRHNAAWLFLDSFPAARAIRWREKYRSEFAEVDAGALDGAAPRARLYLMKPLTYVNLSGDAVGEAADFLRIAPAEILIVHDEIELPLGTVSLKWSGGLGGHNGLRSIRARLGTADFWRLRIGVGKPAAPAGGMPVGQVADYVLGAFGATENAALAAVFESARGLFCEAVSAQDPAPLLAEWGKKKVLAPPPPS